MTWLTWRQSRAQLIGAAATLTGLAVVLAITGPNLAHLYDTSGVAGCRTTASCQTLSSDFGGKLPRIDPILYAIGIGILLLAPGLIGVFWGAPLVTREVEAHTLALAWNQTVTRTRWLAVKLAVLGLLTAASAGLLSLMLTWWSSPMDAALNAGPTVRIDLTRLGPILFDSRDITPVGYAAFAFALGVTAGVLIRRTLPAMAAALAGFAAVQVAWPVWIRQHLIAPVHTIVALDPANIFQVKTNNTSMTINAMPNFEQQGAWVLSSQIVDKAGHPAHLTAPAVCTGNNFAACQAWIGRLHLRQIVSYEPASRFWDFQWAEAAIFVGLAVALAGFCTWWIRRRIT
jgi:uncharacterized membrane protein